MLKRNHRAAKAKRPMTVFGRFILPLTAIMAVALLFFSAKLFFLTSNERSYYSEHNSAVQIESIDEIKDEHLTQNIGNVEDDVPQAPKPPKADTAQKKDSSPIKKKSDENKAAPTTDNKQQKTEKNKISTVKETTTPDTKKTDAAKREKKTTASVETRWDIQTGGFSSKESAAALRDKLVSEGFKVYILDSTHNNAPFYKVRVKGSAKKTEAEKISSVLIEKGYPVYVVSSEPSK